MNGLLDKLDAITPTPEQTSIPDADKRALEQIHTDYKKLEAELLLAEATLSNIHISAPHIRYDYDRLERETKRYRQDARTSHIEDLITHFMTTYHLKLRGYPTEVRELEKNPDHELINAVCQWVLKALNGKTFQQLADEQLQARVRGSLQHARHNRRHLTFQYATSKLELLAHAAYHFEQRGSRAEHDLLQTLRQPRGYYTSNPGLAIHTNLKRCETLTPYKNHNVKVTFATEGDARAFMTYYGIQASNQ